MSIVKMKRLRLVGMRSEREELLRLLQHLGCVEIDEPGEKLALPEWAALSRPDDQALSAAKEAHSNVESALKTLKKYAPKKGGLLTPRPVISEKAFFDETAYEQGLATASHLNELERRIGTLYAEQGKRNAQRLALAPWLSLDIPLETASTGDVAVLFATVAATASFEALEGALRAETELAQLIRAGADPELQYFVLICHRSVEERALEVLKQYGFSRAALRGWTGTARANDERLERELAEIATELEETKKAVGAFQDKQEALNQCLDRADQEIRREQAKSRLLDTDTAFFLDGWLPAADEERLRRRLEAFTCCWETEDPKPEDYPLVPVRLKNGMLTEPASAITEMYSLPAYDGVDPNPLVLPFYVFFFGFMFADLAYGLILAGACAFIQVRLRPKGGFGQLVRLMILCGISSAVIGFFTGGFFSDAIARFCGVIGAQVPQIPFLTVNPVLDVMAEPMTALVFSLVVGLIQILVGMTVKAYMLIRDGHWFDAVCDVGSWWVVFAGLGVFAVTGAWYVLAVGGVMILLTQGRNGKGVFGKISGVFGAVYNGVTGYFGDVLSYSRLMVMMLAGSVIGQVFNILGAMPGNIVFFIIIFIIGHAFNMALNVIGTYVHTSRLQYLEFFKQFYKEGGRPFRPLCVDTKYVDIVKEEE